MASSISVAVRVRPPTEKEKTQLGPAQAANQAVFADGCLSTPTSSSVIASHRSAASLRPIIKVLDQRVLIFDPPESNPVQQAQKQILARLGSGGRKVKDMRFCFDRVFDEFASQEEVYEGAAKDLVGGVLDGYNATAFAYGATGCGKTHTITGTDEAPGIVYLLMRDLFARVEDKRDEMTVEISISYLEIYNETIRDLLSPSSGPLNLREVNASVSVPGLTSSVPTCATDVVQMISAGNAHRTVHGTEANAVSSRSHAVLSVNVRRKPRTEGLSEDWTVATLSVIDLAGSERASVTKNKGERLLEGANINRSLLALGNCINALCDPRKRNHVPYRDSKLTRLLKHSLGGNCRTLMIVCVAPTSAHYDETHNTLQYANRAKEIKTKATRNVISVDRHVSQYVQVIFQLREELENRKRDDEERLERAKREWDKTRREVDQAVEKAKGHWVEAMGKIVPAAQARGQLEGLRRIGDVLSRWRSTVFNDASPPPAWAASPVDRLSSDLHARAASLQTATRAADQSVTMYEALLASLARSLDSKAGPEGRSAFEKEVRGGAEGWGLEGQGKRAVQAGEREGEAKTMGDVVASVAATLQAVTTGFVRALLAESDPEARTTLLAFGEKLDKATREVFEAFGNPSKTASTSAPTASSSKPKSSISSDFFAAPAPALTTLIGGTKRPTGTRSPVESGDTVRPGKFRRASAAVAPGSPNKGTTYFAKKASPRKQVVFPSRANGGILKSRATPASKPSAPVVSFSASAASADKDKGKGGVRWKDEAGQGWELESFDETRTEEDSSNDSLGPPTGPVNVAPIDPFAAPAVPPQPVEESSSAGPPTASASVPTTQEPSARRRSSVGGRMQPGFLSRKKATASRPTTLSSLGEEGEDGESPKPAMPFLQADPHTRPALGDIGNTSVASTASCSSSTLKSSETVSRPMTAAPNRAARRTSSIGPMRTVKTSRRHSLNRDSISVAPSNRPRTTVGPEIPSSSAMALASPKKSPRKGSLRRTSLAPGGLPGVKARRVSAFPTAGGAGLIPSSASAAQVFGNSLRSSDVGASKGPAWR